MLEFSHDRVPVCAEGVSVRSRRVRVIKAGLAAFVSQGFAATDWQDIADRADLSVEEVRAEFATRETLLSAALARFDSERLVAVWDGAAGVGWAGIEAWVELMRLNVREPGVVAFYCELRLLAADPEHPAHDWLLGHLELADEVVRRAVRTGIARGEIRVEIDEVALAAGLQAMVAGIETRWLTYGTNYDPVGAMRHYVDLLRESITTAEFRAGLSSLAGSGGGAG